MTLDEVIKEFLLSKLAGGRAARTLERYEGVLTAFETLAGGCDLGDVTPRLVRRFLAAYRTRGCTQETVLSHYNVLRGFFNWTQREYQLTYNPIGAVDRPLVPSLLPKSLTHEQIKVLLEAAAQSRRPKRNTALVMLMLDTGVRIGEACGLLRGHIDFENLQVRVFGKDKRERMLPISPATGEAFEGYFASRADDLSFAFVTFQGDDTRQMAVRVVQSLFKRLSKVVGFHVNPHLLRSTFGSLWIINGGDEESLRQMMGHTTYAMTRRYVRLRLQDLHDKHAKFSPLTGGKGQKA